MKYNLVFQPGEAFIQVEEGTTVMEAMIEAGLEFDFPCGGIGKCGKCRIKVREGQAEPTARERERLAAKELAEGIRLACLTRVQSDLAVELLEYRKLQHNILLTSDSRSFRIQPQIKKAFIRVEKPSMQDHRSDLKRLHDALVNNGSAAGELEPSVAFLRRLPATLREAEFSLTVVMYNSQLIDIEKQDTTGSLLGMAFDIGTTTIAGYLLDLHSGEELEAVSVLNPQTKFGADVISRISFAKQDDNGLKKLHDAVIEAINSLIGEAAARAGVDRQQVYAVSIAANTTMHHLFLGINPWNIAVSPYIPVVSQSVVVDASDLNIEINRGGKIFVLPSIAGFVGGDTTAVLLATELEKSQEIKLVLDIGTNGEIALGSKEKIVACSAAAGPAFEGAQISSGMRGAAGAIDHVYFDKDVVCSVIGGGAPIGIAGSALLDIAAGLIELGIVDKRGRIMPVEKLTNPSAKLFADRLIKHDGQPAFLLVPENQTGHGRPIMITQGDIRELQLAKGAMTAGVMVLMEKLGVQAEEIKEVLLAGAFGNYLDPHSACVIGLIPPELEGKIKMIGNAAGTGARIALLSAGEYQRAEAIARNVEFVELGSYPGFNNIFAEGMYFSAPG